MSQEKEEEKKGEPEKSPKSSNARKKLEFSPKRLSQLDDGKYQASSLSEIPLTSPIQPQNTPYDLIPMPDLSMESSHEGSPCASFDAQPQEVHQEEKFCAAAKLALEKPATLEHSGKDLTGQDKESAASSLVMTTPLEKLLKKKRNEFSELLPLFTKDQQQRVVTSCKSESKSLTKSADESKQQTKIQKSIVPHRKNENEEEKCSKESTLSTSEIQERSTEDQGDGTEAQSITTCSTSRPDNFARRLAFLARLGNKP